eukprot:maker-scaffold_6-snap-gene-18.40-mRNA-1 protein AED:0.00 eAED:0.00 QI:138/1/1/1/1/1/2/101/610
MSKTILISAIAVGIIHGRILQEEYDYEDPESWVDSFPTCGGDAQSPVDIPAEEFYTTANFVQVANFSMVYGTETHVELENKRTTVELVYADSGISLAGAETLANLVGRSTVDDNHYTLQQVHFHWGEDSSQGSEHTVDGESFPMEMHMVFYNDGVYATFDDAFAASDGLLVIGVFFEEDGGNDVKDDIMENIISALTDDFVANSTAEVEFDLEALVEDVDFSSYYLYPGSLTTPPCSEVVTWVVLKEHIHVSADVLEAFRTVNAEEDTLIGHNFRPVQNGHARPILDSEQNRYTVVSNLPTSYDYSEAGDNWVEEYDICSGFQQSPVDFPLENDFRISLGETELDFARAFEFSYESEHEEIEFENLGNTVELFYSGQEMGLIDADKLLKLVGRFQSDGNKFVLQQAHFHWGENDSAGSEHTVGGRAYPLEMHLVHYNEGRYGSLANSVDQPDGLLVVGIFFEESSIDNTLDDVMKPIIEVLDRAQSTFVSGATAEIEGFSLADLVSELDLTRYYSYPGSLTTPGCFESVTWVVMKDSLKLSSEALEAFQGEHRDQSSLVAPNYRHTQDGHGRMVFDSSLSSFAYIGTDSPATSSTLSVLGVAVAIIARLL